MEKKSFEPLVSICVITFNSRNTIIETLESIKVQTYTNIELIITDDCSSDNTVDICDSWLTDNGSRFVHSEIVTSNVNTGVACNSARGGARCHGEWIKTIAGDDLLVPSAVEEYMSFIANQSERVKICISDLEVFSSDCDVPEIVKRSYEHYFHLENQPYKKQYLHCLQENIFVGPGVIVHRDLYKELRNISVNYGNTDEWPYFYDVLSSGNRIFAINKKLILYRYSPDSLSHNKGTNGMRNRALVLGTCRFFFDYPFRDLLRFHHYLIAWDCFLHYKSIQLYYDSEGAVWAKILNDYSKYLSPYGYFKRIRRIFN